MIEELTKEQQERVINMGAFGYGSEKIASVLDLSHSDIEAAMKDKNSELSVLLRRGADMADYVIDMKLFEQAKKGNLQAIDMLEERKLQR